MNVMFISMKVIMLFKFNVSKPVKFRSMQCGSEVKFNSCLVTNSAIIALRKRCMEAAKNRGGLKVSIFKAM